MVELDSSKVQVILPPLSDADEELHDRETVLSSEESSELSSPSPPVFVIVNVLLLVSVTVFLVLEVILTL